MNAETDWLALDRRIALKMGFAWFKSNRDPNQYLFTNASADRTCGPLFDQIDGDGDYPSGDNAHMATKYGRNYHEDIGLALAAVETLGFRFDLGREDHSDFSGYACRLWTKDWSVCELEYSTESAAQSVAKALVAAIEKQEANSVRG